MAIYSLDQILELILTWEKQLGHAYELLEEYLKDPRSRHVARILQEKQQQHLKELAAIDVKDYRHSELISKLPDYHSEDLVPHFEVDANVSPEAFFEMILRYEERLNDYYLHIYKKLTYTRSKDLFAMLLQFKIGQIKEIKNLMDSYDLVL